MKVNTSTALHARELTRLDFVPGIVTSPLKNTSPFVDLFGLDVGPNTSTGRFSIPTISEHTIAIAVDGCSQGDAWIGGQFSKGQSVPGRLILVPAGADNEWRIYELGVRYFNLFLTPSLLARVATQALAIDPLRAAPNPTLFFEDPLIFHIGMAISRSFRNPGLFDLLYLESLSNTLAVHLLRTYVSSPAPIHEMKGRLHPPVLKKILDYVANSSNADLTLSHLADLAHVSSYHFSRLFKESMGEPVHQYVLRQRLEKSCRLLLGSDMTIAQIAAELGFADESHFIRRFKDLYGISPGALRNDRKNIQ
jgi:AraC family transcriptional regulator